MTYGQWLQVTTRTVAAGASSSGALWAAPSVSGSVKDGTGSPIDIWVVSTQTRLSSSPMSDPEDRRWGMRTRAIHAGARPDPTTGARAVPIYQTTSFVFEDVEDAADLFALQKYGNVYTRLGNPTVAALEERVASLEGGIGSVATSSGQAAETLLFTQLCDAGDHVVASSALYGGTFTLLNVTLRRLGIETTFVAPDDPQAFADAIIPGRTKCLYTEIIANPAGTVADLEALSAVAHEAGL